MKNNKHPGKP